jgi:hypothetical protein
MDILVMGMSPQVVVCKLYLEGIPLFRQLYFTSDVSYQTSLITDTSPKHVSSLDIPPFSQIISATGEPKKAVTEESRLAEAARDAQGKR